MKCSTYTVNNCIYFVLFSCPYVRLMNLKAAGLWILKFGINKHYWQIMVCRRVVVHNLLRDCSISILHYKVILVLKCKFLYCVFTIYIYGKLSMTFLYSKAFLCFGTYSIVFPFYFHSIVFIAFVITQHSVVLIVFDYEWRNLNLWEFREQTN